MKYVIVIPDGCADEPIDALGGKTPLQAAKLPAMDALGPARGAGPVQQHARSICRPAAKWPICVCSATTPTSISPAGSAGSRRPRNHAGSRRLGRALQSGHDRRPDHGRLHRRPHQHRGSDRAAGVGTERIAGRRRDRFAFGVRARSQLPQLDDLSRRAGSRAALFARDPHPSTARLDRFARHRRFSARSRQRHAGAVDEWFG